MTSLQSEIGQIDGVAAATIDPVGDGPIGVKISVRRGYDQAAVALQVKEALRRRGLTAVIEESEPMAAPSGPEPAVLGPPRSEREPTERWGSRATGEEPGPGRGLPAGQSGTGRPAADAPPAPPSSEAKSGIIRAAVSEGPDGLEVAVRLADGRRATRKSGSSVDSMRSAVVAAVYEAAGSVGPVPELRSVEVVPRGAHTSVTVLLEIDRRLLIGSSLMGGTEVLAVARATWAALVLG